MVVACAEDRAGDEGRHYGDEDMVTYTFAKSVYYIRAHKLT